MPRSPRPRRPRAARGGALAAAPHGSRPDHVYKALRDLIVQGKLAPASRIVETEIAAQLGVSRTPVREALQRLQQEGFVTGSPGAQQSRLTVAPLTREDVHELLDIVGALEGLGARRSAELADPRRRELVKELRALNEEFARAGRASPVDHDRLYGADERLHRRLVEAELGPRLLALHDAVKPQAERYIHMYIGMLTRDTASSVQEHDAIIDAVEQGRADDAQRALQTNWRHAAERISKVIGESGVRAGRARG